MTQKLLYGVQIEIHPYPLKNKRVENKWEITLVKLGETYKKGKTTNSPNFFWFETEVEAIKFIKQCWNLPLNTPDFSVKTSIQFPTVYRNSEEDDICEWIDVDSTNIFLMNTPHKDEFTAGLLAPFQHKDINNFLMKQDVWNLEMIAQIEERNGKQWINTLDESNHQVHKGTYKGEFLFHIDRNEWKEPVDKSISHTEEYFQVKDIADGDRYTFTRVRAIGLNTGTEKVLPMEELYIRRSPLMLKPDITRYFFNEIHNFLLDRIKDEIETEIFWSLNVYLWEEWDKEKKYNLLIEAYKLFVQGLVPSADIDLEEVDAAVAAIFIHFKESLLSETEDESSDDSTYSRSLVLNVFNQVHSTDKQSEIVQEIIAIEKTVRNKEIISQLAILYFNEYPITVYSKDGNKWNNVIYYLANTLCNVNILDFEDYYEYE